MRAQVKQRYEICRLSEDPKYREALEGSLRAIKQEMGGNSYRLVAQGDLERVREVPGVRTVVARDGTAKIMLDPETKGAAVLRELVGFLDVVEFRSEEPELEEIFIKVVGDAS